MATFGDILQARGLIAYSFKLQEVKIMAAETTLSIMTDSYKWQSLPVTTYSDSAKQIRD